MKKVLLILFSFLAIGLLSFSNFEIAHVTFANNVMEDEFEVITYDADTTISEYYGASANAIDSVVETNISYSLNIEYVFTVSETTVLELLTYNISSDAFVIYDSVIFSINNSDLFSKIPQNLHVKIEDITGDGKYGFYFSPHAVPLIDIADDYSGDYYISHLQIFPWKTYKITFSSRPFLEGGVNLFLDANIQGDDIVDMLSITDSNIVDLSTLIDVNDLTYYSYRKFTPGSNGDVVAEYEASQSFTSFFSENPYSNLVDFFKLYFVEEDPFPVESSQSRSFCEFYLYNCVSTNPYNGLSGEGWLSNVSQDYGLVVDTGNGLRSYFGNFCCMLKSVAFDYLNVVSSNVYINIDNFEILIDMPTYRSQNSLIIYNYDYDSMLAYVNNVTYRLMRDNCYYDIVFSGEIPNYKTLVVENPNIVNRTFSNYVFLTIDFDIIPFPRDKIINLGFDFNFGNFIEPFPQITTNNSKQTFERPALPTDLTPRLNFEVTDTIPWFRVGLYFPVVKYIEYGFIWLLFYCPIIGDCTSFLYTFFNKFLAIFNIVLDLPMGTFILSFIAFILCFNLFSVFLPFASKKVNVTFKNISNNISNKRKENKQFIENIKKQEYRKIDNLKKKKRVSKKQFNDSNPNRI